MMDHTIGEPNETLEAMRFLWAMVGVSAGVVELRDCQIGPGGERLTCRNRTTGAVVTVYRSHRWTEEEERFYASELDRALNGAEELAPVEGVLVGV